MNTDSNPDHSAGVGGMGETVLGFMCIDSRQVAVVERHDWPNTPGFQNVWIFTATDPALAQPADADAEGGK